MAKIREKLEGDRLYFTSDTHFFHKNIIEYCNRPFSSRNEMNEEIIKRWNEEIPKDGIVFHLGDFALNAAPGPLTELIHRLNGHLYLIVGNHEKDVLKKDKIREFFNSIDDILEIYVEDKEVSHKFQHIVMCHYPMITWNAAHKGSFNLFGHVHGGLSNKGKINHSPNQLDVGVDCHNFYPLSYQEIKNIITRQNLRYK